MIFFSFGAYGIGWWSPVWRYNGYRRMVEVDDYRSGVEGVLVFALV